MTVSFVYIVASQKNGTLYLGVTSDIIKRAAQHKSLSIEGFSKKYRCVRLVWYQTFNDIREAIRKEKQMKKWHRTWKVREIEEMNPGWRDLAWDLERGDGLKLEFEPWRDRW